VYHSSKYYPHSLGLSACFRQWRADSHCAQLHGYPLAFKYDFCTPDLDKHNWVMDFGSMKPVKQWLQETFDHRLMVATDDPELETFQLLHEKRIANINVVPATGCEMFALQAFGFCKRYLSLCGQSPRIHLSQVTVFEHEGNSASYSEPHSFADV